MSRFKPAGIAPVNLDGQADGDYIRNDAGVWKPKTASEVLQDLIFTDEWQDIPVLDAFTYEAFTGSAANRSTRMWRWRAIQTNATANSTAHISTSSFNGWQSGENYVQINWSKLVIISFRVQVLSGTASTTNSEKWVYLGGEYDDAVADPTSEGVGIRCDQNAIKGITHDGSSLDVVNLSSDLSGGELVDIMIVSDNGDVDWYVNNVLQGSSAGGPHVTSDPLHDALRMYLTNGADESNNVWAMHSCKVYFEQ